MKLATRPLPFVLALGAVALLLPGCRDEPTAPERVSEPAALRADADRYIVVLKEGKTAAAMAAPSADVARVGGRIERSHGDIGVLQVRGGPSVAAELRKRADVEAVVKDRRVQWLPPRDRRVTANQKFRAQSNQRGAQFFDVFQWNIKKIRAQQAWNVSTQGAGVTVCVLDTGIDPRQIDLVGKLDLGSSASFVGNERADRDFAAHGTYMASIITSNGLGVASVAPDARVCSVKVLDRDGGGNFGDIIAGIVYVGSLGIDVANMSLGVLLPRNDPDVRALARAIQRAVNFSTNRGVLFVASVGNDAANLNNPDIINLPSDVEHVVRVAATGPIGQRQFDRIAAYSNFGRVGVDVFAPGGDFGFAESVLQDLIIGACSPSFPDPAFACGDRITYILGDGTSQSAAHVSGEAAVIEAELPGDQTPAELAACILETADPLPLPRRTANGRINVFEGQECSAS
jgi:subtilisin family serine protease